MKRIFVIVTPICPTFPGRKVGSKECMSCDLFRGGIVANFVDCAAESAPKLSGRKNVSSGKKKTKKGMKKRK